MCVHSFNHIFSTASPFRLPVQFASTRRARRAAHQPFSPYLFFHARCRPLLVWTSLVSMCPPNSDGSCRRAGVLSRARDDATECYSRLQSSNSFITNPSESIQRCIRKETLLPGGRATHWRTGNVFWRSESLHKPNRDPPGIGTSMSP